MSGIDLAKHALDVRRLAFACPAFRAAVAEGCDRDDLLQQVYASIETRNQGDNPWDPARGKGLGGWVTLVVRSVASNEAAKVRALKARELEVTRELGAEVAEDAPVVYPPDSTMLPSTPPRRPMHADTVQVIRRRTTIERAKTKSRPETRFKLPAEMHRALAKLAREGGQPITWWVRRFISEGLERVKAQGEVG